jgi:hypothetical protein
MRWLVAALAVGIALVGAVAAGFLTLLHGGKASVIGGPVEVLVADRLIQQGTTAYGMQHAYKLAGVPRSQVLTGAITDSATLTDKVALRDVPPGAQLTAADFGPFRGPSCPCSPASAQRAVVVTASKEIGGPIAGGSHADVLVAANNRPNLRELFPNMEILATRGATVTLRAVPQQAGKLIYIMQNTNARLVLRLRK